MSYANENNIEVIKSFQDRAYSGKTTDRPGLEKLILFLRKRKTKTMVIFDTVDRLSRNTEDYFFLKMKIKEYGGFLIPLKDFNLLLQETYVYGSIFEISRKS